jgi:hypothetical protein
MVFAVIIFGTVRTQTDLQSSSKFWTIAAISAPAELECYFFGIQSRILLPAALSGDDQQMITPV